MIILAIWLFISVDCDISITGVIYGAAYGVILGLFLLFKMQATAEGPVSLTTLIGSCAFIIATGFSIFYAGESVSIFQLIGMGFLLMFLKYLPIPVITKYFPASSLKVIGNGNFLMSLNSDKYGATSSSFRCTLIFPALLSFHPRLYIFMVVSLISCINFELDIFIFILPIVFFS